MIDIATFKRACPTNKTPQEWVDALNEFLPKYEINTLRRESMFLAQTSHESSDYRVLHENLNYSQKGLLTVFGKYFKTASHAAQYARQPQKIANYVYAGRMNNVNPNDGWFFKGIGLIQLTGRDNHTRFGKTIGMTAEETRVYMETKRGMVHAACWYWDTNNLNTPSDSMDLETVTKRINGGQNGIVDRRNRLIRILDNGVSSGITSKLIKFGDRGEDVKIVQRALKIKDDGIFGKDTKAAVKRFQRSKNLSADGIVGRDTKQALGIA